MISVQDERLEKCADLVQILNQRAENQPNDIAFEFLSGNQPSVEKLTYAELVNQSKQLATSISKLGKPGDRVILLYPSSLDLIISFCACLYNRFIAIPLEPPRGEALFSKFESIKQNAKAKLILSTSVIETDFLEQDQLGLKWVNTDEVSQNKIHRPHQVKANDVCFLQYTSGSTGSPKGVMVSHHNLLSNLALMYKAFHCDQDSKMVSWLPPYHDMGLIFGICLPLYGGFPGLLMSPLRFMKTPLFWLKTISNYRATLSAAPNFAYDLCVQQLKNNPDIQLDLSSWLVAANGAEPINAETLANFERAFSPYGFRKTSIFPSYGLAEATLMVSTLGSEESYEVTHLSAKALLNHQLEFVDESASDAKPIVSSGLIAQTVRIVDSNHCIDLGEENIGEIWIAGPCVSEGYWDNPKATATAFKAKLKQDKSDLSYLRSGDLGFIYQGQLYVTGRIKDLMILNGCNYYPQDFESLAVTAHPQLRQGCVAAVSMEYKGREELAIICGIKPNTDPSAYLNICVAINQAIAKTFGVPLSRIVLIKPKVLPKTTSGKVKRQLTKQLLESGELQTLFILDKHDQTPDLKVTFVPTAAQNTLAKMLKSLLNEAVIPFNTGFYQLGGDSVIAVQLINQIHDDFGVLLDRQCFSSNPSILELSQIIENSKPFLDKKETISMRRKGSKIPLSFAQERLWFLDQSSQGSPLYNLNFVLHIEGELNITAFNQAFNALIRRHTILRTVFIASRGRPYQKILDDVNLSIQHTDLRELSHVSRVKKRRALMKEERGEAFELGTGPLMRCQLIQFDDQVYDCLLTFHHIITDGWSFSIIAKELSHFYNLALGHSVPSLTPLQYQFADYASWLRRKAKTEQQTEAMSYWKKQMEDAPKKLELTTDRPRGAKQSHQGRVMVSRFSKSMSLKLRQFAQDNHVSLYTLLLSAFYALLYRYTSDDDLVVGSIFANRDHPQTRDMLGMFVKTKPLRVKGLSQLRFSELLGKVSECVSQAERYNAVPLLDLIDELGIERDSSVSPLFQVMFIMQNFSQPQFGFEGLQTQVGIHSDLSKYDLSLECEEVNQQIKLSFEYCSALFKRGSIKRMAKHYMNLAKAMIQEPEQSISKYDYLHANEKRQLLRIWNQSEVRLSLKETLMDLFQAQVIKHPDKIAICCQDVTLTYQGLDRKSNQLANLLLTELKGKKKSVGVYQQAGIDLIISFLAILKAGASFVPLALENPLKRNNFIIEEAKIEVVISNHDDLKTIKLMTKVLCLDELDWNAIADQPVGTDVSTEDLAYIIYTSGSTGQPKGVAIRHQSLTHIIRNYQHHYQLKENDVVSQYMNIGFDAAISEIAPTLATGAELVVIDQNLKQHLPKLQDYLAANKVSICTIPAALFSVFSEFEHPTLRTLIIGGEQIKSFTPCSYQVFNNYGPTEATICATLFKIDRHYHHIPIGKPILNTQIYILDEHRQIQPIGVCGEIAIAGVGVAAGYVNHPKLEAEQFIQNPFSDCPADRLYLTGDIGRWLPEGHIEFHGRIDSQLKIRGFLVETGEVESTLQAYEAVHDCVVVNHKTKAGRSQLIAYVILNPPVIENEALFDSLHSYCEYHLPSYMRPSHVVVMQAFPLSSQGKINTKSLPPPNEYSVDGSAKDLSTCKMEQQLQKIWCKILHLDQISVEDNFFKLGGDSILSMQVVSEAFKHQIKLTSNDIFEHQTIAELAKVAGYDAGHREQHGPLTGEVDLSPIQAWFFEESFEHINHWNQALVFKPKSQVNYEQLSKALVEVLNQHDALRMRYQRGNKAYRQSYGQVIEDCAETRKWLCQYVQLKTNAPKEIDKHIHQIGQELHGRLDIEKGTLFQSALVQQASGYQHLIIVIHHLVIDAVSWSILMSDLDVAYRQIEAGKSCHPLKKSSSLQLWSKRLGRKTHLKSIQKELPHWVKVLKKNKVLSEDLKFASIHSNTINDSRNVQINLSQDSTHALLQSVNDAYQTTTADILIAALVCSMRQWQGVKAWVIDLEAHGRDSLIEGVDLSRTIGWLTSMYPVYLSLENIDSSRFEQLIPDIKEQLRQTPHHGIHYGLLKYVHLESSLRDFTDPVLLGFNYLGQFDKSIHDDRLIFQLAQKDIGSSFGLTNHRVHMIDINAYIINRQLKMVVSYNKQAFSAKAIKQLTGYLETSLEEMIVHCTRPHAGFPTVSDYPYASFTQTELNHCIAKLRKLRGLDKNSHAHQWIDAIYPLYPMQQGMIFHSLKSLDASTLVTQMSFELEGRLDQARFRRAWQTVFNAHSALRTSIVFQQQKQPLQVVHRDLSFPLEVYDWKGQKQAVQKNQFNALLFDERHKGFDLESPPLLRAKLIHRALEKYTFVLSAHHLLFDGWSIPILINQVMTCYAQANTENLLNPGLSSSNYTRYLLGRNAHKSKKYWKKILWGLSEPTALEIFHPSRQLKSSTSKRGYYKTQLTDNLAEQLSLLHHSLGTPLNCLYQLAWGILLSRYTHSDEVVFGHVDSGRNIPLEGIEDAVGLFIHTLPIRLSIEKKDTVASAAQALQVQIQTSRQYLDLSLTEIQSESEVPAGSALFNTLMVYEHYPVDPSFKDKTDLKFKNLQSMENPDYPIALAIKPNHELVLYYDQQQFSEEAIQRLMTHYCQLLDAMAKHPNALIHQLDMLTSDEKKTLFVDWNKTDMVLPDEGIVERFEKQVLIRPDQCALKSNGYVLSYLQLNQLSNQLAHRLKKLNVQQNQIVGIHVERSVHMVVAMLAVLKAGAAFTPIPHHWPLDRVHAVLADSKAKVLLGEEALIGQLSVKIPCIVLESGKGANEPTSNLNCSIKARDLAYVIYTSGSTGKPKGVMLAHRGLLNLVCWYIRQFELSPSDHAAQYSDFGFDAAIWEIFPALIAGATLNIVPDHLKLDMKKLNDYFNQQGISLCFLPTPIYKEFVPYDNHSLKRMTVAGDKLSVSQLPNYTLFNCYGPTEATVCASVHQVCQADSQPPIGKPIANCKLYVLDQHLNPQPIGVVGELYLSGLGIALGYLNQEELTRTHFLPNPFDKYPYDTLYKTGDLARWRPDGSVDFVGRSDQQVKIRGNRVELGEVESMLAKHPAIKRVFVLAKEDSHQRKRLMAYLVLQDPKKTVLPAALNHYLSSICPDYMLPSAYLFIDALPLTPSGKIDEKALPTPELQKDNLGYTLPKSDLEKKLISYWQGLLSVKQVGVTDNFFDLGGDSFLATQLFGYVTMQYKTNMPFTAFLNHPTIEMLAALIMKEDYQKSRIQIKHADVLADLDLDKDIQPCFSKKRTDSVQNVLLTGATGFLGVYLLEALTKIKKMHVYCLIRGSDNIDIKARIVQHCMNYHLKNVTQNKRVKLVIGDLSKPRLGLSDEDYLVLSQKIDTILHCGAFVHHLFDYSKHRVTNVGSLIECLKFAGENRPKRIEYISSLSAAVETDESGQCLEALPQSNHMPETSGYILSKWVSERLLAQAKSRGFDIRVYRPGQIIGDSKTGICPTKNNHFMMLLKGCTQLGYAPEDIRSIDIQAVNRLAAAIVQIMMQARSEEDVFNFATQNAPSSRQLFQWLNQSGYTIDLVPYQKWSSQYLASIGKDNALYALKSLYLNASSQEKMTKLHLPKYISTNTQKALKSGLEFGNLTINEQDFMNNIHFVKPWMDDEG